MSHLGEQLSALVDGELTGAERDRAHAHLASCGECRAEAAALRELKRELRGLAATPADAEFTRRLLAMAGPGGPVPPRHRLLRGRPRPRATFRAYPDSAPPDSARPGSARSCRSAERGGAARPGARPRPGRRRGRYVMLGAVSLVVGIGAAAFGVGGSGGAPGPKITPPVELYSVQHAITTGQVPFPASGTSPP